MKDRIAEIMKAEGLTSGRIAEIGGVQPSAISHILSGRNKPGLEFISNLIRKYPNLNIRWLLLGEQPMYLDHDGNDLAYSGINPGEADLFATPHFNPDRVNKTASTGKIVRGIENPIGNDNSKFTSDGEKSLSYEPEDDIEKIIILYKDGSFRSFSNGR